MIPFRANSLPHSVAAQEMQRVYEALKTPYKLGAVCQRDGEYTDSPSVFRLDDKWYMMYLAISEECAASGYYTRLASSSDLVRWEDMGAVMCRNGENRWDSKQVAGYLGLADTDWNGDSVPGMIDGEYLVTYLGGNADGYEPDPLYMGLAATSDFTNRSAYRRLPQPILSPDDKDCRAQETRALYRSFLFEDRQKVTGYPYVLVYNAKDSDYKERIFLAVSNDAFHWERYGGGPVLDGTAYRPDNKIVGDAQIITMNGLYVMVYFAYDYGQKAYNTFACSYDLEHWTVWQGRPLVESELPFEDLHAHKSWIVRSEGVTYHFYCAVNSRDERFIALATSEKINEKWGK